MEIRHRCKLCSKTFSNGRALGGHMKSHLAAQQTPRKGLGESLTESASSSSPGNRDMIDEKCPVYELRENPKRSCRVADPELSVMDSGTVVQEDRESVTELKTQTKKRTKEKKKQMSTMESPEPLSSVSDTFSESDLAMCLMMLSRDVWKKRKIKREHQDQVEEKVKTTIPKVEILEETKEMATSKPSKTVAYLNRQKRIGSKTREVGAFECPICCKVFSSGQALGGHKRSHSVKDSEVHMSSTKSEILLIDLNLPAPVDESNSSVTLDL